MSGERCSTLVVPSNDRWGAFHRNPCKRKAWKDGYCRQHHPDTVAARQAKQSDEWEKKYKLENKERRLQNAAPDLLAACKNLLVQATLFSHATDPIWESVRNQAMAAITKAEGDK
jgi:hypothetical protein